MLLVSHTEILRVHEAAIDAGLARSREVLLGGIDPGFRETLRVVADPGAQILSDLTVINETGQLADGTVPLWLWLDNAISLAGPRTQAATFRRVRERGAAAPGAPGRGWILGAAIAAALASGGVGGVVWLRGKDKDAAPPSPSATLTPPPGTADATALLPETARSVVVPIGRKLPPSSPVPPAAPSNGQVPLSSRSLSGTGRCEGSVCWLALTHGTFFETVSHVCVDAEVSGVPVTCIMAGDPRGLRLVKCNRSDPAAAVPLSGTFSWRQCDH
jgi:hypothetical protein